MGCHDRSPAIDRRAAAALIAPLLLTVFATAAHANVFSCSGWATGPQGSRVEVAIVPSSSSSWADWTPPHQGDGPLSVTLTYPLGDGGLRGLQDVRVDGELTPEAFDADGQGRITMEADAGSAWVEAWRAGPDASFHIPQMTTAPWGRVEIISLKPYDIRQPPIHPERLDALQGARAIRMAAYGRSGERFSWANYDLSDLEARAALLQLAHARAKAALASKPHAYHCDQDMCECGG